MSLDISRFDKPQEDSSLLPLSVVSVAGQAANKVPVTNGSDGYAFDALATVATSRTRSRPHRFAGL